LEGLWRAGNVHVRTDRIGPARASLYIVYILNDEGRIRGAEWIAACDDADALAQVQRLNLAARCELWQRDRKIGAVGPGARRSSPAP
jgi:hypothetical protein